MKTLVDITRRNAVLESMAGLLAARQHEILSANKQDVEAYTGGEPAMLDRLKIDEAKIKGMITSLRELAALDDPLGVERYHFNHPDGMRISNRTAPFGTVFIIYESRPDVTIEAAGIAFKSGNRILLKGGKESLNSNLLLVALWHEALLSQGLDTGWVRYLEFSREKTRGFLQRPPERIDLIVPRGGEKLIAFVKEHARCPVIVSGRGNNFLFVDREADLEMALAIILNAKTTKISACNALDKVLIDNALPGKSEFIKTLIHSLKKHQVAIWIDGGIAPQQGCRLIEDEAIWSEEFLDYKIALGEVPGPDAAIGMINTYGGGHSAAIVTQNNKRAESFMAQVDAAAVYHNASTRFTDGGQFGLGGELAISTDKLHQRGPIGLQHLCTNKWYVHGTGQVRK